MNPGLQYYPPAPVATHYVAGSYLANDLVSGRTMSPAISVSPSRSDGGRRGSSTSPPRAAERAHRACEKCTRTKKKCDKALPACSRCTRLTTTCSYDYVHAPPAMALVEPAVLAEFLRQSSGGIGGGPEPVTSRRGSDLFTDEAASDITPGQVMDLLSSRGIGWRNSAEIYFRTTQPWLSIIHLELFNQKMAGFDAEDLPTDVDTALLLVCMHLVTEGCLELSVPELPSLHQQYQHHSAVPGGMLKRPLFLGARRIWALVKAFSKPSIELIQCGILFALYEYGHGDMARAYMTLGEAATMARLLNIKPGKYVEEEKDSPVSAEEEQVRVLYWGLFIMDKLLHEECTTSWTTSQIDPPGDDALLPTENLLWDKDTQSYTTSVRRLPCTTPAHVPVGSFQRACQAATLLGWALAYEADNRDTPYLETVDSFFELDVAARKFVEAMVTQTGRWGDFCESFSMCTSLLFLIFTSFLRSVDQSYIHTDSPNIEVMKALAGINFTIRLASDTTQDMVSHVERDPSLLDRHPPPCAYSAFHALKIISNFDHIIPDAEVHLRDLHNSLRYFRRRWAVGDKLLQQADNLLANRARMAAGGHHQGGDHGGSSSGGPSSEGGSQPPRRRIPHAFGTQCDMTREWA